MTVAEQSIVAILRRQLREHCGVLAHPAVVTLERDDGSVINRHMACQIDQLEAAIVKDREVGLETKRRSKGAALPAIISVQAFDIMAGIDMVSRKWNNTRSIPLRVHNAVSTMCNRSTEALPDMRIMTRYLDTWVRLIDELFEPLKRINLQGTCPVCTERSVRVFNMDDREYYQIAALQLTSNGAGYIAECVACGTQWPPSHFELLAQMIR